MQHLLSLNALSVAAPPPPPAPPPAPNGSFTCAQLAAGPTSWSTVAGTRTAVVFGEPLNAHSLPPATPGFNFSLWGDRLEVGWLAVTPRGGAVGARLQASWIGGKSTAGGPCCTATLDANCSVISWDNGAKHWRIPPAAGAKPLPPLPAGPAW